MKKKIFGIALLGFLSTLSAGVISQNGVAKDSATGLMWQDNNDAQTIEKDWNSAKAYCENLTLGGFNDWRLPNIYELTTLLDNTKSSEPYVINGIENIASYNYWSSTTSASSSSYAWVVGFDDGDDAWSNKTNSNYVRCVRAGQLNFDNLVILKNQGKLKVSQKVIDEISPKAEAKRKKEAEIAAKEKAKKEAERDRQAEYDRKNACSRLYVGKTALYLSSYDHGLFGSGNVTIKVQILGVGNGNASVKVVSSPGYGIRQIGDFFEEECSYFK